MQKLLFLITIIVFLVMPITGGCSEEYVEYVPIELVVIKGDHILQKNPELLTPEHIEAMKKILKGYGEPYKIIDNKLYIKKSLMDDLDLLQNYTSKAEGLRKHGVSPVTP